MKAFILALAASALFVVPAMAAKPGAPAPDFTVKDVNGKDVKLSSFRGKTVVIDWANYQCPFDKMHYESGNIPGLQNKYKAKDVVWLTIHSSAPGKQGYHAPDALKAENARVKNGAAFVLTDYDGKVARLYDAKTTPQIYVIDKAGTLKYNGAIDSIPSSKSDTLAKATPLAANAIDAVVAGKTPTPAVSVPYGCSIKFAD
ncbi:redoxin domain-containing protein [Asticcacaulis sp. AND118]|uniref:redoxin domain-containing protein n=1 Tax=Asticcacaulis sp. AND118 TaxID=2840468 RepID=UPI001CFFFD6E|nr:redoxin domain-containing protein [Asticcacaulis sp. AND118]UDF02285.1 redoxin domain-containing protein [Asticcacaulis sp. AND118]